MKEQDPKGAILHNESHRPIIKKRKFYRKVTYSFYFILGVSGTLFIFGALVLYPLPLGVILLFGITLLVPLLLGFLGIAGLRSISDVKIYENGLTIPFSRLIRSRDKFVSFNLIDKVYMNPDLPYITIITSNIKEFIDKEFIYDVQTFKEILEKKVNVINENYKHI